ncbi:sulfotransferase family protein [Fodinicola feengrottensis]|uniref:sulfotransferase family protein n=1 Tax=Fodinicola feengrottensis TaxID=435914 RepID=UPI0024436C09|nr:sulfotransferase [Fodinicola feengrottensis]
MSPENLAGTARRPRSEWPIFVVGCHRSGTTLMRFILDTHPAIACAPETKLMGGLYEFSRYPQLRFALATLGVTSEQGSAELAQLVESIMGKYAARSGKRRWADKTPNYYRILPFIREIFAGEVLFLFVERHPFDTMTSLVEFFDQRVGVDADPETDRISRSFGAGPYSWARYWTEVNESIELFRHEHPEISHVVRYEDVVSRPDSTVGSIFDFLGENMPEDLLSQVFTARRITSGWKTTRSAAPVPFTTGPPCAGRTGSRSGSRPPGDWSDHSRRPSATRRIRRRRLCR